MQIKVSVDQILQVVMLQNKRLCIRYCRSKCCKIGVCRSDIVGHNVSKQVSMDQMWVNILEINFLWFSVLPGGKKCVSRYSCDRHCWSVAVDSAYAEAGNLRPWLGRDVFTGEVNNLIWWHPPQRHNMGFHADPPFWFSLSIARWNFSASKAASSHINLDMW